MLIPIHRKVSLFLLTIAVFYLYLSYQIPSFTGSAIDADTMPKALGYLLIVLSILFFITPDKETVEEKKKRQVSKTDALKLLVVFFMILLYIFLLERIGFILVSALFVFFCTFYLGYKKHVVNAIVSVVFPLFLYLVFSVLLGISLPKGIIPL